MPLVSKSALVEDQHVDGSEENEHSLLAPSPAAVAPRRRHTRLRAKCAAGLALVAAGAAALAAQRSMSRPAASSAEALEGGLVQEAVSKKWWQEYGADAADASKRLAKEMTWEEKARLTSGLGFSWDKYNPREGFFAGTVLDVPRLGVPATNAMDAGAGFRTTDGRIVGTVTSWPSGLAASTAWDTDLMRKYASAIGKEFRRKGANQILGPSVDLARVFRGGRNVESISGEDPNFAAEQTKAYVKGMQGEGVSCVAKHFIMNTQETNRNSHNNIASSKRDLWEVHYPPFVAGIEADLAAVMCSYNGVHGERACENADLLHGDLKGKMGFKGFVMSDWWAVVDKGKGMKSGLDQVQPGNNPSGNTPPWDLNDLKGAGKDYVNDMVSRFLYGMITSNAFEEPVCTPGFGGACPQKLFDDVQQSWDTQLAREVGAASVVLLKNQDKTLPLKQGVKVALLGSACNLQQESDPSKLAWNDGDYYVVGGSGRVLSADTVTIKKGLENAGATVRGSYTDSAEDAMKVLKQSGIDVAIACGGVTSGEAKDRTSLKLDQHDFLVSLSQKMQDAGSKIPLVVITMSTGSILTSDWGARAKAVLSEFLLGQETGNAIADVLFGSVNPSGRLAVTFPDKESDGQPVCLDATCYLKEGVFVGWRNLIGFPVSYPFGHGLSYTSFKYDWKLKPIRSSSLELSVRMEVRVTNVGSAPGHEVVQLYVEFPKYAGNPESVLRGFKKTSKLAPGTSEDVTFELGDKDVSVWWENARNPNCEVRTCYGRSCYTCAERIAWFASPDGGKKTLEEATREIVEIEFPNECARCQPNFPGSRRLTREERHESDGRRLMSHDTAAVEHFVGCFADHTDDRDLSIVKGFGDYDYCSQQCQGYKFFGRQWEFECFCGNSYGKHGTSSDCRCSDDTNLGSGANCVYSQEEKHVAHYVGCFEDKSQDRDFIVLKGIGDYDFCASECKGFDFFGRQWEQECFCGNSYGKHGKTTGCECDSFNVGGDKNCVYKYTHADEQPTPKSTPAPTPKPTPKPTPAAEYVGCFMDNNEDRDFAVKKADGSIGSCQSACAGYAFMGRQWKQECFCGNTYGKHGPEIGCECDSFNIGGNMNCIYRIGEGGGPVTPTPTASPTPAPATESDGWRRMDGAFKVHVGASSRDIRLDDAFDVPQKV
mmetsp:Transcript_285/g.1199  ORF Transcript_285/g.1199 Transcript_285/m.1199 type:complete len:1164 (-) Transcript_285:205-3696(-)